MRKQGGGGPSASQSAAAASEAPEDFGDVSQYRELNAIGTGKTVINPVPNAFLRIAKTVKTDKIVSQYRSSTL